MSKTKTRLSQALLRTKLRIQEFWWSSFIQHIMIFQSLLVFLVFFLTLPLVAWYNYDLYRSDFLDVTNLSWLYALPVTIFINVICLVCAAKVCMSIATGMREVFDDYLGARIRNIKRSEIIEKSRKRKGV